jgi:DNA-3-methyladenine glycosylase II
MPPEEMDAALAAIRKAARKLSRPLLKEIERIGPLTIGPPRIAPIAEHLYEAVVGQQLSVKAADTIWGRVVAAAKARKLTPGEMFVPGFEDELRACGISRNKIKALGAIRAAQEDGRLDHQELAALAHPERSQRLTSIWGVGRWTADMMGIFVFLDPDIWPEGDVAARGAFVRLTGREDTIAMAEGFAPYRSLLARYLWLSRDNAPKVGQ